MKKQDIVILAVLFGLWILWPTIDREIIKKRILKSAPVPAAVQEGGEMPAVAGEPGTKQAAIAEPAPQAEPAPTAEPVAEPLAAMEGEPATREPEQTAVLENEMVRIVVSSHGATVKSAELKDYQATLDAASGPVILDFARARALAYEGLDGLSSLHHFTMKPAADGKTVRFERTTEKGLRFQREITLTDGYLLTVADQISGEGDEAVQIPAHQLRSGVMENLDGAAARGVVYVGADTLSPGGEKVKYWGSSAAKWFKTVRDEKSLPKLPLAVDWPIERPVDWASAKNKYFVQIVQPEGGADLCVIHAEREILPQEISDPAYSPKAAVPSAVWVALSFPEISINPEEPLVRTILYYVGPKKYSALNQYGMHWVDVMEFGMWAPVGKVLLKVMNWIHDALWPHNYGIAIMLLTIIIRILFWPITHKSTESMKKMQAIQPLVNELRAKYKDNQQKQQQEIMALYKEHKVNPVGGCLPMLIQIPVFIALFVVLRSAIELRFAPFLWITDLSQPENLFADALPIPLNILPIIMAVTMVWQQKLTPSAGDPNQQKMMMFMPVMMLVLFYKFAAGLVLYWTTNQCLMIVQQLLMHRKQKAKAAA